MAEDTEKKYKIGEVCRIADLQPYVLRYWETEFQPLAPNKTGGGQRFYTQRDLDIILRIKNLLYAEGFTIAGAKKKLEGELAGGELSEPSTTPPPLPRPVPVASAPPAPPPGSDVIDRLRRELREILTLLDRR
jgi:DNA-binding transcriptional MerR regulator